MVRLITRAAILQLPISSKSLPQLLRVYYSGQLQRIVDSSGTSCNDDPDQGWIPAMTVLHKSALKFNDANCRSNLEIWYCIKVLARRRESLCIAGTHTDAARCKYL